MPRIRLVHWKPAEAGPLLEECRAAGFEVTLEDTEGQSVMTRIRREMPDAVVIDLSRLPSHGREVAIAIRASKSTRFIPILFTGGEPEKVNAIRNILPDAAFTSMGRLVPAIRKALRTRIPEPVVPTAMMDRYAGRTVAQKLGIKERTGAGVIDPPRDYHAVIGELPPGAELIEEPEDIQPVTLWFVHDPESYLDALPRMRNLASKTRLWVLRRKGAAKGFNETVIREGALAFGLVDYKICAAGPQWAAVALARRKAGSAK